MTDADDAPLLMEEDLPASITVPPPDLRAVIDKTADFARRLGASFETKVAQKEAANPKFSFLTNSADPHRQYYLYRKGEWRPEGAHGHHNQHPDGSAAGLTTHTVVSERTPVLAKESLRPRPDVASAAANAPVVEFAVPLLDGVALPAQELDIVRLAAAFVARNGKQFHVGLLNREARNPQFEFLKPTHPLHPLFLYLVDAYSRVLFPARPLLDRLRREAGDRTAVLARLLGKAEHQRAVFRAREADVEDEKLRTARQLIDWHDFVVVETIDFRDEEPAPPPPAAAPPVAPTTATAAVQAEPEDEEMAMEEDDAPLVAPDRSMKIRKDYVPAAKPAGPATARATRVQVCPRCGQEVPVDEMAEHLKIELAAPRGPARGENVFAPAREAALATGGDIAANLNRLARRRTDIFGADEDDEAEAARQAADKKEAQRRAASAWDGHVGSTPAAPASIEAQVAAIHAQKAQLAERPQIGPGLGGAPPLMPQQPPSHMIVPPQQQPPPPLMMTPPQQQPPHHMMQPAPPMMRPPLMSAPPGSLYGGPPPHMMMQPPQQPPPMARAVPLPPGLSPAPPPAATRPPPDDEPESKRVRAADEGSALLPEGEFAAAHPGEYTVRVQVPDAEERPEKSDWRFEGQLLEVQLRATDTFATLKNRLKDLLLIPPNKQRLRTLAHPNFKDQATLAAYNILPNTVIELSAKERGGRKGK